MIEKLIAEVRAGIALHRKTALKPLEGGLLDSLEKLTDICEELAKSNKSLTKAVAALTESEQTDKKIRAWR